MSFKEEYLFWRIAHFLISEKNYRLLTVSPDQNELWLENFWDKTFPVIRLIRTDLDWSNWLRNDIERTFQNGERIRKSLFKKRVNIFNLYVTPLPPVDDYSEYVGTVDRGGNERVSVHSFLLLTSRLPDSLMELAQLIGELPNGISKEEYEPYEIAAEKNAVMNLAVSEAKKERKLFETGRPLFTNLFLGIQIILFFMMEISGGSTNPFVLIQFGAKFNPLILEGEWWRFLTPVFLHIGFFHLFMNSIALYYLGTAVEKLFGSSRFLFLYLFSGFFGSLASFLFSPNIAAGASGAIFGCFGALLYFGLVYPHLFFRTMGMNVIVIVALNLLLGFVVPNIDMAGHIGGLIGGFLASGILYLPKQERFRKRWLFFVGTLLLTAVMLFSGFAFPKV